MKGSLSSRLQLDDKYMWKTTGKIMIKFKEWKVGSSCIFQCIISTRMFSGRTTCPQCDPIMWQDQSVTSPPGIVLSNYLVT